MNMERREMVDEEVCYLSERWRYIVPFAFSMWEAICYISSDFCFEEEV